MQSKQLVKYILIVLATLSFGGSTFAESKLSAKQLSSLSEAHETNFSELLNSTDVDLSKESSLSRKLTRLDRLRSELTVLYVENSLEMNKDLIVRLLNVRNFYLPVIPLKEDFKKSDCKKYFVALRDRADVKDVSSYDNEATVVNSFLIQLCK